MIPRTPTFAASLGTLLACCPALVFADSYNIDSRHTFPSFEVSHLGFSTQRGRFDKTTGKIVLDTARKTGSIHVAIDAASIDTGLGELEDRLRKADFFNVEKFPTINYDADQVVFEGGQPVRAEGTLKFLGVSKPVNLAIGKFKCGFHPIALKAVCGADATGVIQRSDFGMTAFLPMIGDEVKISIQVEGFKE